MVLLRRALVPITHSKRDVTHQTDCRALLIALWGLARKFVTREPDDFETSVVVLFVQLFEASELHGALATVIRLSEPDGGRRSGVTLSGLRSGMWRRGRHTCGVNPLHIRSARFSDCQS